jgi:hypothetical protein
MKILVAISSCLQFEDNHQSMRDTWLPEAVSLGIDYRFFVEQGESSKPDVVTTDNEDWAMTCRLKSKMHWAFHRGYDYLFSCFPDTYVRSDRLLTSGFERFDYFGSVFKHASPGATFYCHGGAGYLLSKGAMEVALRETTSYLNDDCWLGDVLSPSRMVRGHSDDFRQFVGSPTKDNTIVTSHLSYKSNSLGVPYNASFMYAEHKQWIDSGGVLNTNSPILKERALRWKRRL